MLAARAGDFERAAESPNFQLLDRSAEASPSEIARRLYFVLNQELWIDWDLLPDRPDGATDPGLVGQNGDAGRARRSISMGSITLGEREVPVRVQRVDRSSGGASQGTDAPSEGEPASR